MASSTRFATPPPSSQVREPVTPDSGLRNRATPQQTPAGGDASPTSSTISNLSARILEPSRSLYRPITSAPPSALGTPARKIIIRADPAILTCFDPADKELYDLWAPRS
ncbi:hypothetical protein L226DRAFT_608419 [Lentinus tigrinus ALCF2SS1-7]|uniref:Uncharacterized protein n=1 Tax=Lentinus tigrinus ALCF2SS1-6 TaxID=1328759 RepID=A0A5C2STD2_9APHY|nr:hypothetical protein L227DRAFT_605588 [Lentinus tigrinus ALCF2SS1-6]RPD81124.1 hypothetical protein L226DRAFT_608419 [Lentinus tigrinus ALCF2SS1-7]